MAKLDIGLRISSKQPGTYVHYEVSGYVTREGIPARALILIIDNTNLTNYRYLESRPSDGYWVLRWPDNIFPTEQSREKRFCIICKDLNGVYNVKGYDFVTPVRVETIIE